jgi:hypothetical protein
MTLILNGTDNSATTPAVTGTDTDTGIYYPTSNQVAIATNGTQAVLVDSSQNVTFAGYASLPNTFGFKNRIINGAMVIDQRNAGASFSSPNTYTLDRWAFSNGGGQTYTVQQSSTAPTGFVKSLLMTNTNSVAAGTTNYQCLYQVIEGYNIADLGWGTANAQSIAVSFWVRSSVTGTYGSVVRGGASPSAYVSSFSIPVADTWTRITLTIPGCTTDTWNSTNGIGLILYFDLGVGSNYSAAVTGSWTTGNIFGLTGGVKFSATNGATFYATGVQLEKGSTATSFDYRSIGTELALCQRYCQYAGSGSFGSFDGSTAVTIQITEKCVVPMRVAPSGSIISGVTAAFRSTGTDFTVASPTLANFTANTSNYGGTSFWTQVNTFSGGTANSPVTGRNNQTTNGGNFILLTAEL